MTEKRFELTLNPGATFTGVLFTVKVPTNVTLFNSYNAYFEIDGGKDGNAGDLLGSVSFQIEAVPAPAVPEPGNLFLPLAGLAGMAAMVLRRKCWIEPRG